MFWNLIDVDVRFCDEQKSDVTNREMNKILAFEVIMDDNEKYQRFSNMMETKL